MEKGRSPKYKVSILDVLADTGAAGLDFMEAFIRSGYGASFRKIEREIDRVRDRRISNREHRRALAESKRRFEKMVDYLKSQQLLAKEEHKRKGVLKITAEGKRWLNQNVKDGPREISPTRIYHAEPSEAPIIVAFDIPEGKRSKRDWLRSVLKNMGFQMIQKSVWVGYAKIPQRFLKDLKSQNLIEYVEIVEIRKTGTLEIKKE